MKAIKIHPNDKVAVAIETIKAQETFEIDGKNFVAKTEIPAGHKVAIEPIMSGENIIKYGFPIGHAKMDIEVGEHVHSHNVKSNLGDLLTYTYEPSIQEVTPAPSRTFRGYRRKDSKVGIRNEVWIVPTVGCVNSIVREIEAHSQQFLRENIEGIYAYNHPYGCSQLGADWQMTLEYLCGLIHHPNAGAVLVVGLGCENGNID